MENWLEKIQDLVINYAPSVLLAIITLVVGLWVISIVTKFFNKSLKKGNVDNTIIPVLKSLLNISLKVLLFISVAGIFGIETTSFVAAIGALAFAVGMALQGSLGHFASGIMLLVLKPYKVGDLVELGGELGIVHAIQIFNTHINTLDNKRIIIPNGVVTSGVIKNYTEMDDRRVDMTFGIGYGDDIDKARAVIQKTVDACEQILKTKPVDIFVSELADSSVNFVVRPWCKPEDYWTVYFYCHEHIKKNFDKEGVSIPFPQMDVHMDN
jgi:small conductance mechanosensitive channel